MFFIFSQKNHFLKVRLLVGLLLFLASARAQNDTTFWNHFANERDRILDLTYIDLDSALKESELLMRTIIEPKDSLHWSSLIMLQGHIYSDLGKYVAANDKYLETARIRDQLRDKAFAGDAYYSLAALNYSIEQYDKTISYAQKAISYYHLKKEPEKDIGDVYNLIALTHYQSDRSDSALHYYNQVLQLYQGRVIDSSAYTTIFDNMALAYTKEGKFNLALVYLKKSEVILNQTILKGKLAQNYIAQIYVYIRKEDFTSALQYINKVESEASEALTVDDKRTLIDYKLEVTAKTNDIDSLAWWIQDYRQITDMVVAQKIKSNIQDAQTKYEVEKKDAAIRLAHEEAAKLEAQNTAKNRMIFLMIAVFLILILTGVYFYRIVKQKERLSKLELEVKNAELNDLLSNQENEVFSSILKGQEKERERIAMDLHDRLGGTLAALRMSLKKPKYEIEKDDFSILETAITEVRSISHNLSTGLLNKYGLNEAVQKLFATLENSKGIKFSVFFHPKTTKLGQSVGIELYRIVQELVSNTLKHAEATEVSLQTSVENFKFTMVYEDNGKGFDVNKNLGGIGLENIKTRIQNIEGSIEIESTLGSGSKFTITLELNPLKG